MQELYEAAGNRKLIVFDMDNTILDEARYLFAGYEAVARTAAGGDAKLARTLAAWLKDEFQSAGRERLFDRLSKAWPTVRGTVQDWLEELRTVRIALPMLPWVVPFCESLPGAALAILTNGNPAQQRNKHRQLLPAELRDRMRLYCAAESQPKPSPAGLWRILKDHDCPPHAALMIGDGPGDAGCAAAAGVDFAKAPPVSP